LIPKEVKVCSLLYVVQGIYWLVEFGKYGELLARAREQPPYHGGGGGLGVAIAYGFLGFLLVSALFFLVALGVLIGIGQARTGGFVLSGLGVIFGLPFVSLTNVMALFTVISNLICLCLLAIVDVDSYFLPVPQEVYPSPKIHERLYDMLLSTYTQFYGRRSRQVIEDKISSLLKQGLSREVAIRKLAEKEGLIEKE